jgi:cleavage and polyadenylation specificity factor subunit 1
MKLGGSPPIPNRSYSLWIVDAANGWNVVDSYELDEFEHGLTLNVMHLTEFLTEPGGTVEELEEDLDTRLFITVGTGVLDKNGEDVSSKGRVLMFQLALAKEKSLSGSPIAELALVYQKNIFHGPVTTLSCLVSEGKHRLIIGAGSDVNVEQWGNERLTQVGFFRATMQILNIKLFKNFFILSDAYDSLYFLVWRESDKSLTLLAKDYDPIPVYASGIMSRGGNMTIVCHDDRQNLQFFQYAPGDAAARGGNKLVCRADFHIGTQTTSLESYFCRSSLLINSATPASSLAALKQQDAFYGRTDDDQRIGIHFGTTDGGYGAVIPLSEQVYWRLTALQSVMVNAVESNCALSQRAWRMYRRSIRRGGCRSNTRKKGVIDGDLVAEFVDLPLADQEDLASSIGSTVEFIVDNILEIRCSTMVL